MATPVLLGRDEPLRQLHDALAAAQAGRGSLIAIEGEAGVGKSALVAALLEQARSIGAAVAHGRAWEQGAPPYFALAPCLRALGLELHADGGLAHAGADFHGWERVLGELAHLARAAPVLWAIEDVHAADAHSLELLAFLAQPLRTIPALVVVTLRPDVAMADARVARLRREADALPLPPLSVEAATALVRSHAGGLELDTVRALAQASGGNPLFAVELARSARSAGVHASTGVLPATVVHTIAGRVARLPEDTAAVLRDAAVLGLQWSAATLARMQRTLTAAIIDALSPACRAGLVQELAPARFAFGHALVRDAVLQAQTAAARSDAHERAAAALAEQGDGPDLLAARAVHELASLRPERAGAVVELAARAIEASCRQGAFDRAWALTRQLLDVRRGGELSAATVAEWIRAAELALAAGAFADSRACALEAAALARAHGDADGLADAALALGRELRPGEVDPVLVALLEEVLPRLGTSARRCRVAARLAAARQPAADPMQPVALARQALADARALGDGAVVLDVLLHAGAAMTGYCDELETRSLALELLALAGERGDVTTSLRALTRLVLDEGTLGNGEAFDAALERLLQLARGVGHPRSIWRALLMGSMRALERGEFDESERLSTQAQACTHVTDDPALQLSLGAHLLMQLLAAERESETRVALRSAAQSGELPQPAIIVATLTAVVGARLGDHTLIATALSPDRHRVAVTVLHCGLVALLAEGYAELGSVQECRALHQRLAPLRVRENYFGHIAMSYEGPHARVLGLLEQRMGDLDAAEQSLREALERCRARGRRPWVARIGFELARVQQARGREVASALAEVIAEADALGLPVLAARARALGGTSPRVAVAPAPAPAGPPALTMVRDGERWSLRWGERSLAVEDRRGLELLARLIERPGEEVHVLVLGADGGAPLPDSSAGEALDRRAIREYRERLAELDDALAQGSDAGLERERAFLQQELGRALGLGGGLREVGSASERARVNVQRRLKDAIARIERLDAALGRYLRAAVRTGTYCTFRP